MPILWKSGTLSCQSQASWRTGRRSQTCHNKPADFSWACWEQYLSGSRFRLRFLICSWLIAPMHYSLAVYHSDYHKSAGWRSESCGKGWMMMLAGSLWWAQPRVCSLAFLWNHFWSPHSRRSAAAKSWLSAPWSKDCRFESNSWWDWTYRASRAEPKVDSWLPSSLAMAMEVVILLVILALIRWCEWIRSSGYQSIPSRSSQVLNCSSSPSRRSLGPLWNQILLTIRPAPVLICSCLLALLVNSWSPPRKLRIIWGWFHKLSDSGLKVTKSFFGKRATAMLA